uniref:Uncharacterized protein n=1 Tax=Acrobeloides nanus TaxID=290746 RepID=A0A914CD24_9BILA
MYINGRKPTPRCGSSMVMTNEGKLYLIDGVDHKCYLSEIWILDTKVKVEKLEWKRIEQVYNLKGRYTHEAILMDETILLLGGGNGDWSAPFDKVLHFRYPSTLNALCRD